MSSGTSTSVSSRTIVVGVAGVAQVAHRSCDVSADADDGASARAVHSASWASHSDPANTSSRSRCSWSVDVDVAPVAGLAADGRQPWTLTQHQRALLRRAEPVRRRRRCVPDRSEKQLGKLWAPVGLGVEQVSGRRADAATAAASAAVAAPVRWHSRPSTGPKCAGSCGRPPRRPRVRPAGRRRRRTAAVMADPACWSARP